MEGRVQAQIFSVQTSLLKRFDWIVSPAACYLGALFPKAAASVPEKKLILRPGGMGDFICADIALQELGLDARDFTWVIEKRSKPWASFRRLPHVCYDAKPRDAFSRVISRYGLVINTEQRFGLAEAYALACRAKRGRVASFTTNRGSSWSHVKVSYDWRDQHETIEFARLFAAALSLPEVTQPRLPRPRLHPPSAPPLVLIAGRQSPSRCLTLDAWTALIVKWHPKRPFLIAAAPEDADFAAQLIRRFDGVAVPFTGSFNELCEQIARSEEILTMDGGAVHIASFFGVPTLALFTSGRDRKWHPLGEGSRILRRHDLICQPCTKFGQVPPCPYGYACLKLDDVEPTKLW
jgi:ADP-heptose:LPS heptosyltransferase